MIIYPAIDLRRGKVVRLYQGNYASETIYSESPYESAKAFLDQGASFLHLVDLDGAKNVEQNQAELIKALLAALPIQIQVGGGIRTEEQIEAYFAAGASRVIIGTLAVTAPKLVASWLKKYGTARIVLAFDVAFVAGKPILRTEAWQSKSKLSLLDVLDNFSGLGAAHVLCTDISRDGALKGPNLDLYQQLARQFPGLGIQASGGIRHLDDLSCLKKLKVAGAIMGRALYEKKINLSEALSC